MKILHTADVHLRRADDERWQAMKSIIQVARTHQANLIVISGDLFDRGVDAQSLKIPLRQLFDSANIRVVIIPGNHDGGGITSDDFYGQNVTVISHLNQYVDVGEVRVFGLPFEKIVGEKVLERLMTLKKQVKRDAVNILLYHGELLDIMDRSHAFGDEEDGKYMPVRLPFFDDLGIDYVLAGHFHTNFHIQRYNGGFFVYPGSPVSITRRETGPRCVNLFKVGEPPQPVSLDTMYFEDVKVSLNPANKLNPLEVIRERLQSCNPQAKVLLEISGFVDLKSLVLTEQQFASAIESVTTAQVDQVSSKWVDMSLVSENELFKRFMQKLEKSQLPPDRLREIQNMVIDGMMEALYAD